MVQVPRDRANGVDRGVAAPRDPTSLDPEQVRALLEVIAREEAAAAGLIATLQRDHDEIVEAQGWSPPDDEHDPEGATIAVAREQLSALLAQTRADLGALVSARGALTAGTYGRCGRCGGPIGFERLLALPTATTCMTCASRPAR